MIRAFLRDTCRIRPYLRNGMGQALYGEEEVRPCRLEDGVQEKVVYMDPSGRILEEVSTARLFTLGEPVPAGSQVRCGERCMRVLTCEEMVAFGRHHLEVLLR